MNTHKPLPLNSQTPFNSRAKQQTAKPNQALTLCHADGERLQRHWEAAPARQQQHVCTRHGRVVVRDGPLAHLSRARTSMTSWMIQRSCQFVAVWVTGPSIGHGCFAPLLCWS